MEPIIIKIGDADMGGFWFAMGGQFADGFPSGHAAEAAALAARPAGSAFEIWYETIDHQGRAIAVPGPKSANHPEVLGIEF